MSKVYTLGRATVLSAVCVLCSTGFAYGERLCVAVADPQGLPVGDVAVQLEPMATSAVRRGVTSQDGQWCSDAPAGVYVARAFGKGMEGAASSVTVRADASEQRVDLRLALAAVASQVEVTASRLPESLLEAPMPVRQIDSGTIKKLGARQLNDALQEQPELVTFAGGTMSGGGSTNLQGFSSRDVEILVDGQPLTGRVSGYIDLNQFDASIIEAVEIKTGASAMTYGQQGMGGAINLITRRAGAGSHASLETGYGSFNTGLVRADGGFSSGGLAVYAAASTQRGLGHDLDQKVLGKTQSANRTRNLFGSLYLPQWRNWNTGLTYLWLDQEFWGYEGSEVTGIYDFARPKRRMTVLPRASLSLGSSGLLTLRARRLYYRSDEDLVYRNPVSLRAQATHSEANGGDVEWSLATQSGYRMSTGLFFNRQSMIGDRLSTPANRAETDVWSQVVTGEIPIFRSLRLIAGYRADHDTNFGGRFSPQAALAFKPTRFLSLSASATRGIRAPDFNELYIVHTHAGGRVRIIGDPTLRPQQSWSFHTSALVNLGSKARLDFRLFHNDMTDLIQTTIVGRQGSASIYQYGNIGEARIRGGSVSATYALHRRLELTGSWQYLDTLNRDAFTVLEYAPRHRGSFRTTWSDPRRGLLVSFFGNATSTTFFGVSSGQRTYMQAFEQFGINTQKELTRRVALRCTLRNLTDNVDPARRLTAPFSVEASLKFTLGRIE